MTKAAELAGFKVEFKNTAWDGIFIGLANKQYDAVMSSVTITEERKAEMDFSTPYINAGQILVVRKNQTGVTTLADLAGKKAGAQINTTGAMEIQKTGNVELKAYDELGFAIEDLKNGKIDGVVADAPTAADFVLSNADNSAKLMIVGEPFTEEYYGVAVRKGNTKVLEIINSGIEALVESGADKEIIAKWLR
jgi:polar amino acid transport system substrate-binding protein